MAKLGERDSRPAARRPKSWVRVALLLVIVGFLAYRAWQRQQPPPDAPPPPPTAVADAPDPTAGDEAPDATSVDQARNTAAVNKLPDASSTDESPDASADSPSEESSPPAAQQSLAKTPSPKSPPAESRPSANALPADSPRSATKERQVARTIVRDQTIRDLDGEVAFQGDVDLGPTLARIRAGKELRYRNDGSVFQNRERRLPRKPVGYYREYVHETPGLSGPGPQRIVVGKEGEVYYTPDHYRTFQRIDAR